MPQLKSDARPRSVPGTRVKAESRASGSASALALTRETGTDTLKGRKKRSTSNTVAERTRVFFLVSAQRKPVLDRLNARYPHQYAGHLHRRPRRRTARRRDPPIG